MVSKEQAKTLLQHYNLIPTKIKALQSAIRHMTDGSDTADDIESLCLSQSLSGMPFASEGNVTDKTAACAHGIDKGTNNAVIEHASAIGILQYVKEQLDIAIDALPDNERAIVKFILVDGIPYERLTEEQRKQIGYYSIASTYKHANANATTIGKMVVFGEQIYLKAAKALNITPK